MGRKSDREYVPEYAEIAGMLCQLGRTYAEIRQVFQVKAGVFNRWRREHSELDEALAINKKMANAKVSKALFDKAIGYSYKAEQTVMKDGSIRTTWKHVPADVAAQIFYLKNLDSENFKDVRDQNMNLNTTGDVTTIQLPDNHRDVCAVDLGENDVRR